MLFDWLFWKKISFSYYITHRTAYMMLVLWNICTNLFLLKPAQAEKKYCLTAALMWPCWYITNFRWRESVPLQHFFNHISDHPTSAFLFPSQDVLNVLFANCTSLPIHICCVLPAKSIVAPHVSSSHLWDVTLAIVVQVSHRLTREPGCVAILRTTPCKKMIVNTKQEIECNIKPQLLSCVVQCAYMKVVGAPKFSQKSLYLSQFITLAAQISSKYL